VSSSWSFIRQQIWLLWLKTAGPADTYRLLVLMARIIFREVKCSVENIRTIS